MSKAVLLNIVCQHSIMPLLAFLFATIFRLEAEVAAGHILSSRQCPIDGLLDEFTKGTW